MNENQGTQERKRRKRAAPSPEGSFGELRVLVVLGAIAAILGLAHFVTKSDVFLVLEFLAALLFVLILFSFAKGMWLLYRVLSEWSPQGFRCLVVHSDSPVWKDHVDQEWLPRLDSFAAKLNWSERARWGASLEAQVFRHFCYPSRRNFNPAVIVFRGLRAPFVFRFYEAFHEAKIGRGRYLDELEAAMFEALSVPT
jgi:hypothetical protein